MALQNYDAFGQPIVGALNWEDSPIADICAVPGCTHKTNIFGWLQWGGRIGYVCADHRSDEQALDNLITARLDKLKNK